MKIIGATGIVTGMGIAAYTVLTGDHMFSYAEAAASSLPIFFGGIIGMWEEHKAERTEEKSALERVAERAEEYKKMLDDLE